MDNWIKIGDQGLTFFIIAVLLTMIIQKILPRIIARVPFVGPNDLAQKRNNGDDILVLDVRNTEEFEGKLGHIPGSLNVPLAELQNRISEAGGEIADLKDTPVFVICKTGSRAARAARMLKQSGFSALYVVDGGIVKWRQAKLPTE